MLYKTWLKKEGYKAYKGKLGVKILRKRLKHKKFIAEEIKREKEILKLKTLKRKSDFINVLTEQKKRKKLKPKKSYGRLVKYTHRKYKKKPKDFKTKYFLYIFEFVCKVSKIIIVHNFIVRVNEKRISDYNQLYHLAGKKHVHHYKHHRCKSLELQKIISKGEIKI